MGAHPTIITRPAAMSLIETSSCFADGLEGLREPDFRSYQLVKWPLSISSVEPSEYTNMKLISQSVVGAYISSLFSQ